MFSFFLLQNSNYWNMALISLIYWWDMFEYNPFLQAGKSGPHWPQLLNHRSKQHHLLSRIFAKLSSNRQLQLLLNWVRLLFTIGSTPSYLTLPHPTLCYPTTPGMVSRFCSRLAFATFKGTRGLEYEDKLKYEFNFKYEDDLKYEERSQI